MLAQQRALADLPDSREALAGADHLLDHHSLQALAGADHLLDHHSHQALAGADPRIR